MRYYDLTLTNASGQVYQPSANGLGFALGNSGSTFTSFVNGQTDMGALNLEFDCPIYAYHQSQGKQWIRIWGIGLPMIGQAFNLNGANFSLSAGMKPGLPLATAAAPQAGILLQGMVFQAFGNWEGVNQTLELVVNPSASDISNISWNWPANTPMGGAISTTLAQAFPTYTATVSVGAELVLPNTDPGIYTSLPAFASYLNQISLKVGQVAYGKPYPGVQITVAGNTIAVFDGKGLTAAKVVPLAFQDLIGQPTWISATQISFKTVLRSDIAVGMEVTLPRGIAAPYALTSVAAATPNAPVSSRTAFQGTFVVTEVHHFANFRQPDAESWNTSFVGVSTGVPTGTGFVDLPGFYSP